MIKIYRDKDWFIEHYLKRKRTLTDIGEECGVRAGTIYSWRIKHGIEKVHRPSDNNTVVKIQCRYCKKDFETTLRYVWRRVRDEKRTYFYCDNDCQTSSLIGTKRPESGLRGKDSPSWKGGVSGINEILRGDLKAWKLKHLREQNFTCFITGDKRGDFHVHHETPFHEIRDKALEVMDIELQPTLAENDDDLIDSLRERIVALHEFEKGYVIKPNVHFLFHRIYGDKTTEEDLLEFKTRYLSGEFDEKEAV